MILLVSCYTTHAQFTYNWEARAKAERERDNQAYIDARSKNTPYAPYTVDKEAIKKMVLLKHAFFSHLNFRCFFHLL